MASELRITVTDVPAGTCRGYQVHGKEVMVYNLAGTFLATQGLCTHEDLPISGGRFTENVIECPWHGSRFNVRSGKVLTPPAEENLQTYPVRVAGDTVVVTISEPSTHDELTNF